MNYIIIGNTAHLAGFEGDFDELINHFPASVLNSLEILGVEKVVWGLEGQYWENLDEFPKLAD